MILKTNKVIVFSLTVFMMSALMTCFFDFKRDNPNDPNGENFTRSFDLTAKISPAAGETDVSIYSNIVITFSEEVNNNGWTVTSGVNIYNKNSPEISWNGNVLIIAPIVLVGNIKINLYGFNASLDNEKLSGITESTFTTWFVYPVSDTGQTNCYYYTTDWIEDISCAQTYSVGNSDYPHGQDAHYSDKPNARLFTGPTQYGTTDNYTVKDNVTGLVWTKCSMKNNGTVDNSAGCTDADQMTISVALTYCTDLNQLNDGAGYGGRNDWRLPVIEESNTLPDFNRSNPAIDTTYFPGTETSHYWSSSIYFNQRWGVYFFSGSTEAINEGSVAYVRCVSGP